MNKSKNIIGIVGAGISGLSVARELERGATTTLFEKERTAGGLLRCSNESGVLYHRVGGHVFNAKTKVTKDKFFNIVGGEKHFIKHERSASIELDGSKIGYPIEDHIYQLPVSDVKNIISELLELTGRVCCSKNFKELLVNTFGRTLCEKYFFPYNEKVWMGALENISVKWLEGKFPQPSVEDLLYNNVMKRQEKSMVHAQFYYPKDGGSQFVVDRFAEGQDIVTDFSVDSISAKDGKVLLNEQYAFDALVYTGDITKAAAVFQIDNDRLNELLEKCKRLRSRGLQNALVRGGKHEGSWTYLPATELKSNRVIHTGNFSEKNSPDGVSSGVVEFAEALPLEELEHQVKLIDPDYEVVAHNFIEKAYVIQDDDTSGIILEVKEILRDYNIYLLGRFAEWQYYNVDKCMEAAAKLSSQIEKDLYEKEN